MKRFIFSILFIVSVSQFGLAYGGDIAIVVNKENITDEISFEHLVNIFKQEKQFWKDGKKIYVIMQEVGSFEKEIILEKIYKMNDQELKKFWLSKIFKGDISSFPKTLSSSESVKRFVSQVPNAIGFIDTSLVDESIKVLRVDGKLPEDKDYILRDEIRDED